LLPVSFLDVSIGGAVAEFCGEEVGAITGDV